MEPVTAALFFLGAALLGIVAGVACGAISREFDAMESPCRS